MAKCEIELKVNAELFNKVVEAATLTGALCAAMSVLDKKSELFGVDLTAMKAEIDKVAKAVTEKVAEASGLKG